MKSPYNPTHSANPTQTLYPKPFHHIVRIDFVILVNFVGLFPNILPEVPPPLAPNLANNLPIPLQILLGASNLHIADVNYALGDLLRIVATQAESMP